ncbi:MAG: twin-arginine translocation signal domain-containing protein [Bacillota bacterium]
MEEQKTGGEKLPAKQGLSRRNFFKASGIAAGALSLGAVTKAAPALAGEKSHSAIINFAVKEVDKPPYQMYPYADADKLKRYDESLQAFNNKELSKREFGGAFLNDFG